MLLSFMCLRTTAVLALFYLIKKIFDYVVMVCHIQKLPGPPKKNIFFGNVGFHNKTPAIIFDSLNKWASQYYPLYRLWIFHVSMANILCLEDFEAVLSNIKHEKKGMVYVVLLRWLKSGLLTSEDFIAVFNEETDYLVQVLKNEVQKSSTEIGPIVSQFTLRALGETAIGTKFKFDNQTEIEYKKAIYDIMALFLHRMFRPWLFYNFLYMFSPCCFKERQMVKNLHSFTKKVIKKRETELTGLNHDGKKKRLAMLDLLLSAKAQGLIDDEGIREEVDTFMFEGHDTTAVALGFCLMLIACHKEVQDQIIEEMRQVLGDTKRKLTYSDLQELKYLERCIKESLRLYPSVSFISRYLGKDLVTSGGHKLKKGSMVNLFIYALHHNPDIYPDPERFDPDRFLPENCQRHPFAYVPFSAGPRNCIGQRLAILELKTVICGILANFILEPIDTPDTVVLVADLVLRTKDGIKIKFLTRHD